MDSHPVSLVRFASNGLFVATFAAMIPSVLAGVGPGSLAWMWIIFAVALTGSAAQFAASLLWRRGLESSWDEQVRTSNTASYVFGYWIAMAVFLTFLAAVWRGAMSAEAAFYWLGTPLAVAPSLWMLLAFLRGRAG